MSDFNGYKLSRRFWDWAVSCEGNRTPTHAALYAWFVESANRKNWPDYFSMSPQEAMNAVGVSSYNNYKKVLADLVGVGFVQIVREGRNQYAPAQIALSNIDIALNEDYVIPKSGDLSNAMSKNDKAKGFAVSYAMSKNDKAKDDQKSAMSNATSKNDITCDIAHDIAHDIAQPSPIVYNILKLKKPKPETKKQILLVGFRDELLTKKCWIYLIKNKKRDPFKLREVSPSPPPTIVTLIRQLIENRIEGYYWQAKDGFAAKAIADKLKNAIQTKFKKDCSDDDILNALTVMIERTSELPTYYQFTDLPALNGKFNEVITQLRSTSQVRANSRSIARPVAPGHQSVEQRAAKTRELFDAIDSAFSD